MLKLFRIALLKPQILTPFYRPIHYNFARVSKKEEMKEKKKQEKQTLNLANTIDFEPFQQKFDQFIVKFKEQVSKLQVGKLTPNMLDNMKVQCYGEKLPLSSVAQVSQKSSAMLQLNVFEEGIINDIMKVLIQKYNETLENSDLNLLIKRQEKTIILQLAQGNTKESRIQAVNNLKKMIEDAKLQMRDIRHQCLENLKPYKKVASEDTVRKAEREIQDIFEKEVGQLDTIFKNKEKELMK